MGERVIGVIGGSGIYDLDGLRDVEELAVDTPFGAPSDKFIRGRLGDAVLVFLARHGRGHRVLPHEVNYRANIYGMKSLGVDWLIAVSAVGSMRLEIRPGDLVVVDQYIDRTWGRAGTFFGDGVAAHVSFGDPVSPVLADLLYQAAVDRVKAGGGGERVHRGGTYLCINGPQFSSRAESDVYRKSFQVSVIGMTAMPEAKLAREAEISYATLALSTDYDCWHEGEEEVSADAVVAVVKKNARLAREVIAAAAARIPAEHDCIAASALKGAIMTDPSAIPAETRARLAPIIGKYVS
ncbi:MAG TPA: S-methyl-5'-thioadenosine phosphorylase [Kofleriaceae bacterium]|nr:S-methyl-5'-thioadenosine phosphorylase [Kofleriaceae bacterium]